MGKKSHDFKIMVGSFNTLHSTVWSIKLRKGDVYLMTDSGGNAHKVSLHKSGIVHSALTQEKYKDFEMEHNDRTRVRWSKALQLNQADIMYSIIFPHSELYEASLNTPLEGVLQVPLSEKHEATVVNFIKVRTDAGRISLCCSNSNKTQSLHSVKIDDEHFLNVSYYHTSLLNDEIRQARKQSQMLYRAMFDKESAKPSLNYYFDKTVRPSEKEKIIIPSCFVTIDLHNVPHCIEFRIK